MFQRHPSSGLQYSNKDIPMNHLARDDQGLQEELVIPDLSLSNQCVEKRDTDHEALLWSFQMGSVSSFSFPKQANTGCWKFLPDGLGNPKKVYLLSVVYQNNFVSE